MKDAWKYLNGWEWLGVVILAWITVGMAVGETMSGEFPFVTFVLGIFGYAYWTSLEEAIFTRKLALELQPKAGMDMLVGQLAVKGYQILTRGKNQIQFLRKKRFSLVWSLAWLCVFGVGLVVYVLYYLSKQDELLTITFGTREPAQD